MCGGQNKAKNFSDIMDKKAIKPPKTGTAPWALPDYTVLTGNQGGLPKSQTNTTNNPALSGKMGNGDLLTPDSGDSLKSMNATSGFDPTTSSWAEEVNKASQEDTSLLDTSAEEAEVSPKAKQKKGKKGKRGGEEKSSQEPARKKAKPGLTWADVAKNHICLITSANLDEMLDHEDYLHIQREILKVLIDVPRADFVKLQVVKSGVREGIIQIALEKGEGANW